MSIDISQFLEVFYEESFEGLETMERVLLELQPGMADLEAVNTIFRAAHSIKGGSGTFGLDPVTRFTHLLETLLDEMRSGRRAVSAELITLLLEATDCLGALLRACRDRSNVDEARSAHITERLSALLTVPCSAPAPESTPVMAVAPREQRWRIEFAPLPHLFRTGNDPLRILRELDALGVRERCRIDTSALPDWYDFDPESCYLAWQVELSSSASAAVLREPFDWVDGDCRLEVTPVVDESEPSAPPGAAASVEDPSRASASTSASSTRSGSEATERRSPDSSSIRVGIDKVDAIINMVGELVITQSMLSQFSQDFDLGMLGRLRDGLQQLARNTRELQETVLKIRMLPISVSFNRFPRLVRDLGERLGKRIELRMSGETTELDKTVLEKIGDPLVHLVRNALDHGIETPEERRAAGKAETGRLVLNAAHNGGNIVIEVSDDGRGLDAARILAKARERGLVGADEELSDERIFDLIFQPGFSTASTVSEVSGRGVGMDVVRRNIKALQGSIETTSKLGLGTTFTIRLPLTLAILDGQLVRVGDQIYVIPLSAIVESLQASGRHIHRVAGGGEIYRLREQYIPVLRVYDSLGVEPDSRGLDRGLLVVVEADGEKAAMHVDELLGQQQVVIKSLETNFQRVAGLSGATILGDGRVAMILDVSGLVGIWRAAGGERLSRAARTSEELAA